MFDIAFSELVVIAVIALIVIGPEKLPRVARTLGLLMGRMQRYLSNVKADINRELQLEDLQKLQDEMRQGASHIQGELHQAGSEAMNGARSVEQSIGSAIHEAKKPSAAPDNHQ